jgi:Coenzyme PQQ synthesis protein D (PqqD)
LRYRVNSPQVISETVGGETIIVNLATGHYFNLQGTAVAVWDGLVRDEPAETIVACLVASYAAPDGEIEDAVGRFLADLAESDLVTPEDEGAAGPDAPAAPPPDGQELPPFTPPSFTRYTDMQDIILLDPVHEVDARGWPHAPAGA